MDKPKYQLIGRRADRRDSLIFRDRKGRHFIRPACGAKLVRLTARDAKRLLQHDAYNLVLDGMWRSEPEAVGLECPLPMPFDSDVSIEDVG